MSLYPLSFHPRPAGILGFRKDFGYLAPQKYVALLLTPFLGGERRIEG